MKGPELNKRSKPKSDASLYFPVGADVQPQGFKELEIDQEVMITIKGTVKSISDSVYEDGGSKDLRIKLKSCSIGKSGPKGALSFQSDKD